MALDFRKMAAKGDDFLAELAKDLGCSDDLGKAGRILRAILHAVRRQLTTEESIQLLSQLPLFLKAVYVENWTLHERKNKARRLDDLFQQIRELDQTAAENDFPTNNELEVSIAAVFGRLKRYISQGELEDMRAVLPKGLKPIIPNAVNQTF